MVKKLEFGTTNKKSGGS